MSALKMKEVSPGVKTASKVQGKDGWFEDFEFNIPFVNVENFI